MRKPYAWTLAVCAFNSAGVVLAQGLPPVPVPPQNPITEPKRLLGKVLFWDEQLSSDNTIACGTCHLPERSGADPRRVRNPGFDGISPSPDDVFASPGVVRCDALNEFDPDDAFGLQPQVTRRAANPAVMAMYAPELFWDGRAPTQFVDPQTGEVRIPFGGALESQAVGPVTNDVEMSHEQRDWEEVVAKLERVRPLAIAANLPADLAAVVASRPTYGELFARAFGDEAITSGRIAFAIATYERTLLPDQTPWDRFVAGDPAALTPGQIQGLNALQATTCFACHAPPFFTNHAFRNVGLRPTQEDTGRQEVTGLAGDRGRFKVPTLRNVGLKPSFMHNGALTNLNQVLDFYLEINGQVQFPDNQDPLVPAIVLPPDARPAVIDFLANGLTDPRVAAGAFPFDRPRLHSQQAPPNPALLGPGSAGSGGFVPAMIALSPPNLGNEDFKIGVERGLAGAQASVAISHTPPVGGVLTPEELIGPISLNGSGPGSGYATLQWPLVADYTRLGEVLYMQWQIEDSGAAGGVARSPVAQLTFFCNHCPCIGDVTRDGIVNLIDLSELLVNFGSTDSAFEQGDFTGDGIVDLLDLSELLRSLGFVCG